MNQRFQMRALKFGIPAVAAVVAVAGYVVFVRDNARYGSSTAAPREQVSLVKTVIGELDADQQASNAASSVNALRQSHKAMESSLDKVLNLSESEAAQVGDILNLQSAQAEKGLLDSLSSLTQQLIAEPGMVPGVIAMLRDEQDPQLMALLAQALGEAAATLGSDFPHDALIEMALHDENMARREAAIIALSYMNEIPDSLRQQMTSLAQAGPTPQVRSLAIDCLGQWMNRQPEMATQVTDALLAARTATDDDLVRGMVIQTLGNSNQPLTEKTLAAMSDALLHETVAGNRSLAAVALGSGSTPENRSAVIAQLENAYQNEPNLDTRRHIITQIVKAAREDSALYLQRLPTPHNLLQQDVNDYLEIMAGSNSSDWGSIWDQKSHRDNLRGTYPGADGGHGAQPPSLL